MFKDTAEGFNNIGWANGYVYIIVVVINMADIVNIVIFDFDISLI